MSPKGSSSVAKDLITIVNIASIIFAIQGLRCTLKTDHNPWLAKLQYKKDPQK